MRIEIEIDTTRSDNDNVVTRLQVRYPKTLNKATNVYADKIIPELERIFEVLKADALKNQAWCNKVYFERQPDEEENKLEVVKMCRNCKFQTAPCAFFLKRICSNPIGVGNHPEMNAGVMWELA